MVAPAGRVKRLAGGLAENLVNSKYSDDDEPEYDRIPCLVTQYLPPLPRTVTVTQVEGCPAKVAEEEDTLIPRSVEARPSLASARAPSATVGLKMSSSPSSGLEPLTDRHCSGLADVAVVVDGEPEFPEFPELDVEPEFAEQ